MMPPKAKPDELTKTALSILRTLLLLLRLHSSGDPFSDTPNYGVEQDGGLCTFWIFAV